MATVILAPFTLLVTITVRYPAFVNLSMLQVTLNYYLRAHEAHMATQNVHKNTFRHRINKDEPASGRYGLETSQNPYSELLHECP